METVQEVITYLEEELDRTTAMVKYCRMHIPEDVNKYIQRMYVLEEILQVIDPGE